MQTNYHERIKNSIDRYGKRQAKPQAPEGERRQERMGPNGVNF
jgi:hypothetical protein